MSAREPVPKCDVAAKTLLLAFKAYHAMHEKLLLELAACKLQAELILSSPPKDLRATSVSS